MKRKRGTLDLRGVLGTIAILSVLFAIGAAGAILFNRMRKQPELLAQSPMAAAQPASPTPASKESPSPSKARSANPISAAGAADMMSGGGLQTQPAPKQVPAANPSVPPTHAQQNELKIPSQPPPASNALTLPTESMLDSSRSSKVTAYLKSHRLPFVTAQVYRDASGAPAFLMLSGKVATDFGKQDAETRTLGFLGTPNLALDNQIQVDPGVQTATNPAPRQAGTLKLPSVFKGCWELAIDQQDGPVRLLPGAPEGCVYTQDSGRFCYQRTASGDFEPTFSSLRLKPGLYGNQADQWSRVEVLSTDGVDSMRMRFLLHHSDVGNALPFFSTRESIDESHQLSCTVAGATMRCEDQEYGRLGGRPWCVALHNDEFRRVAN
ncbi:MAG: hypothetical protein WA740_08680 [Candidatus Binataceae bacterium]